MSQSLHSQHRDRAGARGGAQAGEGPPEFSYGSRDALLVFFGTLAAGAVCLVAVMIAVPERFGLARPGDPVAPSDASRPSANQEEVKHEPGRSDVEIRMGSAAASEESSGRRPAPGRIQDALRSWESRVPTEILAPRSIAEGAPGERRQAVVRSPSPDPVGELIFEDAQATVVHVTTLPIRRQGVPMTESVVGTGSGLVWDRHGHIVTSRHVIERVGGANVLFADGRGLSAKFIAADEATDIAVLRVDAPPGTLTPIRVGTSYDLRVGMRAFSVACPYGLRHSLASGLISGLDRTIRLTTALQLGGTIQTDTSVQPGCSGGALIDDQGRVIGMNAAIHWDSQREPGVGFALPIDLLQDVVPRLIREGLRWHFEFGFVTATAALSEDFLERVGAKNAATPLPGGTTAGTPLVRAQRPYVPDSGLVVMGVDPGTAAAEAGLRGTFEQRLPTGMVSTFVRDIVVTAGGEPVVDSDDIQAAIDRLGPGEPLRLGVARGSGVVPVVLPRGKP